MNDTERLDLYFERQAARVALPDGDARMIVARANHRRRNRRMVTGGLGVAVLAVAMLGLATQRRETHLSVADAPAGSTTAPRTSTAGPLAWTAVDVPNGLGWSTSSVTSGDGSLFSLSTAPGAQRLPSDRPPTLYHSTDGRTWAEVALPDGLSPSALATAPGHLYAVGTAAAGGGVDVVVAASTDDAKTWTQARLPVDPTGLKARFGNQVQFWHPVVTSGPAGTLAAVTVVATPEVDQLLANKGVSLNGGFLEDADGVHLLKADASCDVGGTVPPAAEAPAPSISTDPNVAAKTAGTTAGTVPYPEPACKRTPPEVERSFTWDELGLDPELRALVPGRVRLFSSTDGATFTPAPSSAAILTGRVQALVGSGDGYRLIVASGRDDEASELFSADGSTWRTTGLSSGWVRTTGLLAGRPVAVVDRKDSTHLLLATAGGGWDDVDLRAAWQAVGIDGAAGLIDLAVGPLGLVGVVSTDGSPGGTFVIESADGATFTSARLGDLVGAGDWSVLGISVNADAAVVRVAAGPPSGLPESTVPSTAQRLLVGTRS